MNIIEFQSRFKHQPVLPVIEIEQHFSDFDKNALTRWQKKNYLEKIRNGFYRFKDQRVTEDTLFLIAGKIYTPSYISLESALSFYQLIPEGVFSITSITTLKTQSFSTPIATFSYQSVKPNLFFGYRLEKTLLILLFCRKIE